jgi:peptide/nickel transport system ATP-binding protein
MPVLRVENYSLTFDARTRGAPLALDGVSFEVGYRHTVALVGESGSGKSTLALAAMGLLPAHAKRLSGRIMFDDPQAGPIDVAALGAGGRGFRSLRGRRIGLVFQEPLSAFSPVHRIGPQAAETVRVHEGLGARAAKARVLALFARVGLPDPERAYLAYPFELSGGMRQRAMIATALIGHPVLLIADEPTTALDVTVQAQVLALLDGLKDEMGLSLLFITHDLGVVAAIADDVVVMRAGRVLERGPAEDVFTAARHPYFIALQDANPRLDQPQARLAAPDTQTDTGRVFTGNGGAKRSDEQGSALIAVEDVSLSYKGRNGALVPALDHVDFAVARGEALGLVGESGSGKTTLARAIMRAVRPAQGRILFHAKGERHDLWRADAKALASFRRRVAYVFQDPYAALNPRMSVREMLIEPLAVNRIGDTAMRRSRAASMLDLVGLPRSALDRFPPAFSGGQRQRLAIARALMGQPELLILDEPTSSLDVSVQAQILNMLAEIRRRLGIAMLFVSHDLAVVAHIADRVAVMRAGRIVEDGPADAVLGAPLHPYTQALLAAAPPADYAHRLDLKTAARPPEPAAWPDAFRVAPGAPARFETQARDGRTQRVLVAAA